MKKDNKAGGTPTIFLIDELGQFPGHTELMKAKYIAGCDPYNEDSKTKINVQIIERKKL